MITELRLRLASLLHQLARWVDPEPPTTLADFARAVDELRRTDPRFSIQVDLDREPQLMPGEPERGTRRTTPNPLYLKGGKAAHEKRYEIHEDGPLGHDPQCARRVGPTAGELRIGTAAELGHPPLPFPEGTELLGWDAPARMGTVRLPDGTEKEVSWSQLMPGEPD